MRNIVGFLIEASKLKEMPRTGWVWRSVKNPETVADHTFSMAVMSWVLSQQMGLSAKKAIKIALAHDLCEVYAGDITPNLYYQNLPQKGLRRKKILMKWARLSVKKKTGIEKVKLAKEKRALLRLLKNLEPGVKNDIFSCWLDFEKWFSKEGKFVNQINRVETLLQSIKYFGVKNVKEMTTWWEWVEELVDDPDLLEFCETIHKKFYKEKIKTSISSENVLNFIVKTTELKHAPRLYWRLRGVKAPETVAGHIYILALAAWALAAGRKEFNMEKLLKMALCHELSAVFTGDTTPYDRILNGNEKQKKQILKRIFRMSRKEKEIIFLKDYREEKKSLEKLTSKLKPKLRKEMLQSWHEYRTKSSPEGKFLSQLNVAMVLFQGLIYEKKYKNFSAAPLWEWAFEVSDHPLILELLDAMKQKFSK